MTWLGTGTAANRVKVGIATDNAPTRLYMAEKPCQTAESSTPPCAAARVAVRVKVGRGKAAAEVYRSVLTPDANGSLDASVAIPVPANRRRVCAEAQFVYDDANALSGKCNADRVPVGRAHVELVRPPRG